MVSSSEYIPRFPTNEFLLDLIKKVKWGLAWHHLG
jgi:hypothetical protein